MDISQSFFQKENNLKFNGRVKPNRKAAVVSSSIPTALLNEMKQFDHFKKRANAKKRFTPVHQQFIKAARQIQEVWDNTYRALPAKPILGKARARTEKEEQVRKDFADSIGINNIKEKLTNLDSLRAHEEVRKKIVERRALHQNQPEAFEVKSVSPEQLRQLEELPEREVKIETPAQREAVDAFMSYRNKLTEGNVPFEKETMDKVMENIRIAFGVGEREMAKLKIIDA